MRSLVRDDVRASNHSLSSDTHLRTNDDSSTVQARHSTRLNNKIQKFVFECKSHYVQLYTKTRILECARRNELGISRQILNMT